ncbi:MAG: dTMP kinase [Halorhodospira sp.]
MQGRFITIEGVEGAGKTTCLEAIRATLQEAGAPEPVITREPGGTPFGEALRQVLLDPQYAGMTPEAEALTVFAARAEHLMRVIFPALSTGQWVVSDRFTDATYAYQGGGRGLGDERVASLEAWVHGGFTPDRTLLLDVDPAVGHARVTARGSAADRFEQEQEAFFRAARAAYHRRAAAEPERFRVIDAHQPADVVASQVRAEIQDLLATTGGGA